MAVYGVSENSCLQKISYNGLLKGDGNSITAADGWTDDATLGTRTYKKLTVAAEGRNPLAAFRKNGEKYEQVVAYLAVNGTNVDIAFLEAFDGYVICV